MKRRLNKGSCKETIHPVKTKTAAISTYVEIRNFVTGRINLCNMLKIVTDFRHFFKNLVLVDTFFAANEQHLIRNFGNFSKG
ncbi:MAG: hypothetical protein LBG19_01200 [Prevotellaceae bacterium]|jgi:hypothetical protein|nr:hypothetical protein [Prevotellaceae bacterium]